MSDAHAASAPDGGGRKIPVTVFIYVAAVLAAIVLAVMGDKRPDGIFVLGSVPFAFVLFVLVLLGVAFFHHYTLYVALTGALVISIYTAAMAPGHHWAPEVAEHGGGLWQHFLHEGNHTLLNLLGLLLGFALLAKFFEHSGVPDNLPRLLPRNPLFSSFILLTIVWFISSFLDNIAAAMLGGVIARVVFKQRVTVAYVAAIVAASNAGGAWSVVGDTTTTMMWIDHVPPGEVAHAFIASLAALLVFGFISSAQQNKVQAIERPPKGAAKPIDWIQLVIVAVILGCAITTAALLDRPFVGVWAAILLGSLLRRPAWEEVPGAFKGAVFLLSLVWCASLMPVERLPSPSWQSAFGLGFVSAVFDNIPLTKLALEQNNYDWGMLAYSVGFGGSMIWFGSSAGVAISKDFPEARSTARYLKEGWPVALAYVIGFFVMYLVLGWEPYHHA